MLEQMASVAHPDPAVPKLLLKLVRPLNIDVTTKGKIESTNQYRRSILLAKTREIVIYATRCKICSLYRTVLSNTMSQSPSKPCMNKKQKRVLAPLYTCLRLQVGCVNILCVCGVGYGKFYCLWFFSKLSTESLHDGPADDRKRYKLESKFEFKLVGYKNPNWAEIHFYLFIENKLLHILVPKSDFPKMNCFCRDITFSSERLDVLTKPKLFIFVCWKRLFFPFRVELSKCCLFGERLLYYTNVFWYYIQRYARNSVFRIFSVDIFWEFSWTCAA